MRSRLGPRLCGTAGLRCALRESDVACAHLTTIVRPAEPLAPLSVCVCAMCLCVVFGVACTADAQTRPYAIALRRSTAQH